MENWDPQIMLDLYIHNYLRKKKMNLTADVFAREANFYPKEVAIDCPEGFLSEWWSIFWSIFSTRFPNAPEQNTMPESINPTTQTPTLASLLQSLDLSTMSLAEIESVLQTEFSVAPSEMGPPIPDFGMGVQNFVAPTMHRQEYPGHPIGYTPQLLNANQLACVLPSPLNSQIQGTICRNPHLSIIEDQRPGPSTRPSTFPEVTCLPPQAIALGVEQIAQMLPSSSNSSQIQGTICRNPYLSIIEDQRPGPSTRPFPFSEVTCLPPQAIALGVEQIAQMLPSSSNSSQIQGMICRNPHLSIIEDQRPGPSTRPSPFPEVTCLPPQAIALGVEQIAQMLPSSSNSSQIQGTICRNPHLSIIEDQRPGPSTRPSTFPEVTCPPPQAIPLGVEQIAPMLPSSSNSSYPREKFFNMPMLSITRDDECGTSLKISTEPSHKRSIDPSESKVHDHEILRHAIKDSNAMSPCLHAEQEATVKPSSSNNSLPCTNKKPRLSVTEDEECGTSAKQSIVEPSCASPKDLKSELKAADSGKELCYLFWYFGESLKYKSLQLLRLRQFYGCYNVSRVFISVDDGLKEKGHKVFVEV